MKKEYSTPNMELHPIFLRSSICSAAPNMTSPGETPPGKKDAPARKLYV